MKLKILLLFFLVFAVSCQKEDLTVDSGGEGDQAYFNPEGAVKGWVRIKLKREFENISPMISTRGFVESGNEQIDELARELGATEVRRLFPDGGRFEQRRRDAGLHLWYEIYFDESVPVTRATRGFAELPQIDIAEPVPLIKRYDAENKFPYLTKSAEIRPVSASRDLSFPFDDPLIDKQWHYNNTGSINNSLEGADVNLFAAWQVNTGHPDVIIGVVDGGIDYTHEDLAAHMWVNEVELNGAPNTDNDGNGYKNDVYGFNFVNNSGNIQFGQHGTHVAGTITAVNNNGKGVSGVAGGDGVNPGVRVMSCQIFTDWSSGGGEKAIVYSADNGAVISQNSWGGMGGTALQEAVNYFIKNAGMDENGNQEGPMAGGLVIVAAGNDNTVVPSYPAGYPGVISVASMASDYVAAPYTSYGNWVDLIAPGGTDSRNPPYLDENGVYSTDVGNKYAYLSGTSMACPHVSGIAALIISEYGVGQPGLTADMVKDILIGSTRREVYDYNPTREGRIGTGLIDAGMALKADSGQKPESPVMEIETDFTSATVGWKIVKDNNGRTVRRYEIIYSTNQLKDSDFTSPGSGVEKLTIEKSVEAGKEVKEEITGLLRSTKYYFGIAAVDPYGNRSNPRYVDATLPTNQPPAVTEPFEDIVFAAPGEYLSEVINLRERFTDPDGDDRKITFTHMNSDPEVLDSSLPRTAILTLIPIGYGVATVTIEATDDEGDVTRVTFKVTVGEVDPDPDPNPNPNPNPNPDPDPNTDILVLWPNPVQDHFYFTPAGGYNGEVKVKVVNSGGRTALEDNISSSTASPGRVDVSKLSGGTYSVVFEYGGRTDRRNIIKR